MKREKVLTEQNVRKKKREWKNRPNKTNKSERRRKSCWLWIRISNHFHCSFFDEWLLNTQSFLSNFERFFFSAAERTKTMAKKKTAKWFLIDWIDWDENFFVSFCLIFTFVSFLLFFCHHFSFMNLWHCVINHFPFVMRRFESCLIIYCIYLFRFQQQRTLRKARENIDDEKEEKVSMRNRCVLIRPIQTMAQHNLILMLKTCFRRVRAKCCNEKHIGIPIMCTLISVKKLPSSQLWLCGFFSVTASCIRSLYHLHMTFGHISVDPIVDGVQEHRKTLKKSNVVWFNMSHDAQNINLFMNFIVRLIQSVFVHSIFEICQTEKKKTISTSFCWHSGELLNEFEFLKSRVDDKVRKTHIETPSKWRIVNVSQDNVSDDLGNIQFKHIESNVQGTIALIFFFVSNLFNVKNIRHVDGIGKNSAVECNDLWNNHWHL